MEANESEMILGDAPERKTKRLDVARWKAQERLDRLGLGIYTPSGPKGKSLNHCQRTINAWSDTIASELSADGKALTFGQRNLIQTAMCLYRRALHALVLLREQHEKMDPETQVAMYRESTKALQERDRVLRELGIMDIDTDTPITFCGN